jgi:hypothetical protein
MADTATFVGTWKGGHRSGLSFATITWTLEGGELRGQWIIEPSDPSRVPEGMPEQIDMKIVEAWVEDGVVLFRTENSPWPAEFRLVGDDEAVVGGAVDKLPPKIRERLTQRAIEGHRFHVRREPAA